MTDFRKRVIDQLGMKLREGQAEFPDDVEKFWGNNYHRIYDVRELRGWLGRQKRSE